MHLEKELEKLGTKIGERAKFKAKFWKYKKSKNHSEILAEHSTKTSTATESDVSFSDFDLDILEDNF